MNNLLHKLTVIPRRDRLIQLKGIGVGFALLHLVLTWRLLHRTDQVVMNALFWIAILGLLFHQHYVQYHVQYHTQQHTQKPAQQHNKFYSQDYSQESDRIPRSVGRFIGRSLLGLLVVGSFAVNPVAAWFVRLFPAVTLLSLGLLASGFQLRQYWRSGLLLLPLMLPKGIVESAAEQTVGKPVQVLTAQVAAFVLHYLGFDAVQKSSVITLHQGAVDVLFRCTGIPLFFLLVQLAALFLIVFSIPRRQQIQIIGIAATIAFWLSTFRVALMAVLVQDRVAFDYWHDGSGAQIFSTGAIVLFGWVCQQFLPRIQID